ncbi:MAG: VWA domain-containing protein [Myxococcota bacterium]|nr:VWA domain-containing protein [Myxococcota bacterium]
MTWPLQHPEWVGYAVALVGLATGLLVLARVRQERRRSRLLGRKRSGWLGRRDVLLAASLACIAVAAIGPLVGTERVRLPANGLDVVILLDVSRSMDAGDTPPSRLLRARRAASQTLTDMAPGDRAALVVFAGKAAALTPLTPDKAALRDLLDYVDTRLTSDPSSHLEAGLEVALGTFDPESARPRRLLVLSDGEHAGDTSAAILAELRRAGVRVVAGAIGSEAGGRIPSPRGQWLDDSRGEPVISRRDAAALRRIAEETSGSVWLADAFGSFASGRLAAALAEGATPAGEGFVEQEIPVALTRLPAAVALLLLGFELVYRGRSRGRTPPQPARPTATRRRAARVVAATALSALALGAEGGGPDLGTLEAQVRRTPDDAHLLLELGVTRAQEGQMREAERAFLAASLRARDPELTALAYYDLGVALLSRGHYEGARDAFFDALAMDPELEAARFNLEWTLRALSLDPPPMTGPGDAQQPPDSDSGEKDPNEGEEESESARPDEAPPEARPNSRPERRNAPELSGDEAERWLDAARDDPSRALRGALDDEGTPGSGGGPRW